MFYPPGPRFRLRDPLEMEDSLHRHNNSQVALSRIRGITRAVSMKVALGMRHLGLKMDDTGDLKALTEVAEERPFLHRQQY